MYVVYYLFAGKHANIKKKQGREKGGILVWQVDSQKRILRVNLISW